MEDKIKGILEGFDFQKVHDYMVLTNWTWANPYGISIPSVQELKSTAAILLRSVASDEKEYSSTATGGFVAHKFPWGLDLNFALHRRSSY
jgi:hypothetical protein